MRTKLKQKKRTKNYPSTTTTTTTTKTATKTASKSATRATRTKRKPSKRLKKPTKTSGTSSTTLLGSTASTSSAAAVSSSNPATSSTTTTINHPHQQLLGKDTLENAILNYKLKKATIKFEKACKQLLLLDQKINDLQNSYTSSMETDRKTFKIVNRMQLATLEGTHEAYIEYIERKVEEIRQLKYKISGNENNETTSSSSNNTDNSVIIVGASASNQTNSRPLS